MKIVPALLLTLAVAASAADPQQGKKIYVRGEGSSPIQAVTDAAGTVIIPATVLPCVNCHDYDGRGKAEGAIRPSNLQWQELTRSYATPARSHPPYTPATLKRAIAMGIDPAGNELDRAMPRYRMSLRDADDLVAYLQILGRVSDPGLSDDSVRIGVLLSPDKARAEAVRDVVTAVFDAINRGGGLYGRRVDIRYLELPVDVSARRDAARKFLDAERPFALTASSLLGAETPLAALIEEREIPSIAAFSGDAPEGRYLFRIHGALAEEIAALRASVSGPVLEVSATTPLASLASAPTLLVTAPPARLPDILRAAASLQPVPRVLVPSTLAGEAVFLAPPPLDGRITIALPTQPLTADALRELQSLSPRAPAHPQTAATALAAARVLAEALRRAGRELSREKLIETLEGFYNFPTPAPITFGPATRVGTRGMRVGDVDLKTKSIVWR